MPVTRWLIAILVPAGVALAGCGEAAPRSAAPRRAVIEAAFRGSPPALVSLHAQAGRILGGGVPAFRARLRALRGHPVVINVWGSWCEPCQTEFPVFQRAAVADGRRVAFLGVDVADRSGAATAFLRRFPVTYPSYADPHKAIVSWLRTLDATPQTFYYDAAGHEQYDHAGPYTSLAVLQRDVRAYLGVSTR